MVGRKNNKYTPPLRRNHQRVAVFDLEQYFDTALQLVQRADRQYRDRITLAHHSIDLLTQSVILRDKFIPALSHLADISNPNLADLTIYYVENSDLERGLTAPPSELFNAQGFATGLDQSEIQIYYQPWVRQLFLYSQSQKIGIYWAIDAAEVPWWETTFSFRVIFHWWSRNKPLQLMHAGAMSNDGESGWLIPGPSGSGKSTSCMRLLLQGTYYLSDDYVIVSTEAPFKVFSLYQTAKINADNFDSSFSALASQLTNPDTYQEQKAVLLIGQHYPKQLLTEIKLLGILVPKITDQEHSSMQAVSPAKALMSIAPTTLFHLPHHREDAFAKISRVVNSVPTFQWLLGSDTPSLINSFQTLETEKVSTNA
jgi:hypothetical protein